MSRFFSIFAITVGVSLAVPAFAASLGKPVAPSLVATLQKASHTGLGYPKTAETIYFKAIDGPRINKGNKVGLLYIGADYCPYCAGQRWALTLTLLRFGQLGGLEYMRSSPTDVYSNTVTVTFQHASYTSKYVNFRPVEISDRYGKKLQEPTKAENDIFNKFDAPPYMPSFGGVPFVYLDGQYVVTRPLLMPGQIGGMNWQQVAAALANPASRLFQSVMPQVNAFTAAICRLDGGNPDSVCSAPGVTNANGALLRLAQSQGGGS